MCRGMEYLDVTAVTAGTRDRDHTVLAAHRPASLTEHRNNDLVNLKVVEADSCCRNIHDRVHGSHLMKMDLFYTGPVSLGLRLCEYLKNSHRLLSCTVRDLCPAKDLKNFCEPPVFVVMRMMSVISVRMVVADVP